MSHVTDTNRKVLLVEDGGVGWIRFNRPEQANTIDREFAQHFIDAVLHCDLHPEIRVVVLTGSGRFFCAGGDLQAIFHSEAGISGELRQITARMHAAISVLLRMNKPVVSAINGQTAGAGVSLAALGDLAIAAKSAGFKLAFTAAGLSPDCASTWILPRLIGLRKAQELALRNPKITSEEAESMGLITRVVADEEFDSAIAALAGELACGPTWALGATRRLLLHSFYNTVESQTALEGQFLVEAGLTHDASEGIGAFLSKRAPDFQGD